ncbi:MAG: molybdopterin cofactor-binding domain-containing protein, partial [Vicinamibacterales bacterium]
MGRAVGANVRRKDGDAKVTGAARYIDDLAFPGMLFGATIRSTIPNGEIIGKRLTLGDGFIVADFTDIPGRNFVALIDEDQPCLAERFVRHAAEPILLVAHADRHRLFGVEQHVAIDYRAGAPLYDPEASTVCFKEISINKGDLARGFREADRVIEGEYRTGHQEQLYIETNGVIAVPGAGVPGADGITVYGSLQCPYYVHKALVVL